MLFLGWMLVKPDCNANNCIQNEYFLDWISIYDCAGNSNLRNSNNKLTEENNNLRNNLKNLKDEINILKGKKRRKKII